MARKIKRVQFPPEKPKPKRSFAKYKKQVPCPQCERSMRNGDLKRHSRTCGKPRISNKNLEQYNLKRYEAKMLRYKRLIT